MMIRLPITLALFLAVVFGAAGCCGKNPQTILDKFKGQPVKTLQQENDDVVMEKDYSYAFIDKGSTPKEDGGAVYEFDMVYQFSGSFCDEETAHVRAVADPQGTITEISTE
ncbi:MAG: hypothetical protein AB7D07_14785 [Desulfovibrionaceae bacterium]